MRSIMTSDAISAIVCANHMSEPAWNIFFENAVRAMLVPGARVLDIGGGLRVDAARGNVEDPARAWIKPLLVQADYRVMDPVDTYHPDIVGDVMAMPLPDASEDAVICLSVLEHVPRPWDAAREIYRVLKPGGSVLLYIPFLTAYHAHPGYYGDFVRFTKEGNIALLDGFTDIRMTPVRGPSETVAHLLPGMLGRLARPLGRLVDRFHKGSGNQTAGYGTLARKPKAVSG